MRKRDSLNASVRPSGTSPAEMQALVEQFLLGTLATVRSIFSLYIL